MLFSLGSQWFGVNLITPEMTRIVLYICTSTTQVHSILQLSKQTQAQKCAR